MKRYYVSLIVLVIILVLLAFCAMWFKPEMYLTVMPFLALYFGVVTGVQHFIVVKSMARAPKTFVQVFLASVIGVLFLHLAVMALYIFNNPAQAHSFMIAFCVGYVASLVFETIALVRFVNNERKRRNGEGK